MSHRDDFLDYFNRRLPLRLAEITAAFTTAMLDQDSDAMASLRAERQTLRTFAAALPETDDPAALAALWPEGLGALPLRITDPDAALALDPPNPEPVEVKLSLPDDEPLEVLAPEDEAAIVALREVRRVEEDALRATGKVVVAMNSDRPMRPEDLGAPA